LTVVTERGLQFDLRVLRFGAVQKGDIIGETIDTTHRNTSRDNGSFVLLQCNPPRIVSPPLRSVLSSTLTASSLRIGLGVDSMREVYVTQGGKRLSIVPDTPDAKIV
jgi:hypothetical protein